ncbi:MAG: flagellar basal body rod protein FlgB [Gammaproteobacteria bacterium]|nr:flagellar basal body rod protein FlgB [Gammaproteobacteria bacterium]
MTNILDQHFGIHAKALTVRSQRSELLASNIANAETPNYKARDLDFKSILSSEAKANDDSLGNTMLSTANGHIHDNEFSANTLYRVPNQSALDGNTVDPHMEHSQFTENAVRYQISLQLLNSKITGMLKALTGD